MKCPSCGKWNPVSMPHCKFCGASLEPDDGFFSASAPTWQNQLKDDPGKFVVVDDTGDAENTADYRDALANEMVSLRKRKREGEKRQKELRAESAARGYAPSGRTVRTTSNRTTFFSSMPDNPDATLRPVDPELIETDDAPSPRPAFTSSFRSTRQQVNRTRERGSHPFDSSRRAPALGESNEEQPIYDGYQDTSEYIPECQRTDEYERRMGVTGSTHVSAANTFHKAGQCRKIQNHRRYGHSHLVKKHRRKIRNRS